MNTSTAACDLREALGCLSATFNELSTRCRLFHTLSMASWLYSGRVNTKRLSFELQPSYYISQKNFNWSNAVKNIFDYGPVHSLLLHCFLPFSSHQLIEINDQHQMFKGVSLVIWNSVTSTEKIKVKNHIRESWTLR